MDKTITPTNPQNYAAALAADPNLKSPHTRAAYAAQLGYFEVYRAGRPLTVTLVKSYLARLQELGKSPASVKQALAAIRWLARFSIDIAYDTHPQDEAEQIESALLRVVNIHDPKTPAPLPAGRHITDDEIRLLLGGCDDGTPAGTRDGAMIALLHGTGIRVDELCNLRLDDVKYNTPQKATITVSKGKGGKRRIVTVHPPLLDRLTAWIDRRGVAGEYLFCRLERNGTPRTDNPLTTAGFRHILDRRFLASPLREHLTPHDFRRTLAGNLFSANVDPATIASILGHEDIKTTQRYDRRDEQIADQALREIQEGL